MAKPLYREHELAFRTQYAELKEGTLGTGELLRGTPGSLALRSGSTLPTHWGILLIVEPAPCLTSRQAQC